RQERRRAARRAERRPPYRRRGPRGREARGGPRRRGPRRSCGCPSSPPPTRAALICLALVGAVEGGHPAAARALDDGPALVVRAKAGDVGGAEDAHGEPPRSLHQLVRRASRRSRASERHVRALSTIPAMRARAIATRTISPRSPSIA